MFFWYFLIFHNFGKSLFSMYWARWPCIASVGRLGDETNYSNRRGHLRSKYHKNRIFDKIGSLIKIVFLIKSGPKFSQQFNKKFGAPGSLFEWVDRPIKPSSARVRGWPCRAPFRPRPRPWLGATPDESATWLWGHRGRNQREKSCRSVASDHDLVKIWKIRFFMNSFFHYFLSFERYFKVRKYQNRAQHEKIPPGSHP